MPKLPYLEVYKQGSDYGKNSHKSHMSFAPDS
jgi:hypothetical protein